MANPHSLTFHQDAARRDVFQLLQQTRSKPLPGKLQILELLGIGEATYPVPEEDQVILVHHLLARRGLGGAEMVADHLENHIEGWEGEDAHHQALVSGSQLEVAIALLEVAQERPNQLGLPVLVIAEGGIELVYRLLRHEGEEEVHHCAGALQLYLEIRTGEAEYDAHFIRGGENRVHFDSVVAVDQRQNEGQVGSTDPQPADEIRSLVAIEGDRDDFDGVERHVAALALELFRQGIGGQSGIELQVAEERREGEVSKKLLDHRLDPAADHVGSQHLLDRGRRKGTKVGVLEVDPRRRPRHPYQLAGHRIEEGQRQLGIRLTRGDAGILGSQCLPELELAVRRTKRSLQVLNHPVHELAVQREPLHGILLTPTPVPLDEACGGTAGHQSELCLVRVINREDRLGGFHDQAVAEDAVGDGV